MIFLYFLRDFPCFMIVLVVLFNRQAARPGTVDKSHRRMEIQPFDVPGVGRLKEGRKVNDL